MAAVAQDVTCGLIGYGALARQMIAAFPPEAVRWCVLSRAGPDPHLPDHVRQVSGLGELIAARPVLVVEAASQQSVGDHVPEILQEGLPVVLASVGALADAAIAARLESARRSSGTRLIIPAGSVGGLDYLEAVARLPDTAVTYTSRKPVAAWADELGRRGLGVTSGEVVLFEGTADEAARLFPKNLNAAFTIASAVWPVQLRVRVVADPTARGNTHEIEAVSAAGEATLRFVNMPSADNPKSSMVTALSLAAAVRRFLSETRGH